MNVVVCHMITCLHVCIMLRFFYCYEIDNFKMKKNLFIPPVYEVYRGYIVIPPVYEVYRGYIVFAFSVCVWVCVCVCV